MTALFFFSYSLIGLGFWFTSKLWIPKVFKENAYTLGANTYTPDAEFVSFIGPIFWPLAISICAVIVLTRPFVSRLMKSKESFDDWVDDLEASREERKLAQKVETVKELPAPGYRDMNCLRCGHEVKQNK